MDINVFTTVPAKIDLKLYQTKAVYLANARGH